MAQLVKYETNSGAIARVRLSSAMIAVAGAAPTGAALPFIVRACHSSARRSQLRARGVRVRRELGTIAGTDPAIPVFEYANITCLTAARQTALLAASDVTYDGQTWTPVASISEG